MGCSFGAFQLFKLSPVAHHTEPWFGSGGSNAVRIWCWSELIKIGTLYLNLWKPNGNVCYIRVSILVVFIIAALELRFPTTCCTFGSSLVAGNSSSCCPRDVFVSSYCQVKLTLEVVTAYIDDSSVDVIARGPKDWFKGLLGKISWTLPSWISEEGVLGLDLP